MSRRTMPYHRRYHGDALQGFRKLTLEQRGACQTILDLIYDEGGPIENNERYLAGELNCSLRKCRALLSELLTLRKLYINAQGKISNHRCETEIEYAVKISRKRSEVASKPRPKADDDAKFRNKISADHEQKQSNSLIIPKPEPYKNSSTEFEAPEGEPFFDGSMMDSAFSDQPKNGRLVAALEKRGSGRAEVLAMSQHRRRSH